MNKRLDLYAACLRKSILVSGILLLTLLITDTSTLFAYQLTGVKWPQPSATFYVDIPGEDGLWNDAFEGAMDEWGAATVFDYDIVRGVYSDPCNQNNRNGVGFSPTHCGDDWGSTTLAICTWWYVDSTSTIVEADIVFNSNESWNVYSSPWWSGSWYGVNDFRRVAVHELGHALGLGHEDSGVLTIMGSYAGDVTTPQQDDINGVAAIYGEPECTYSISPTSGSFLAGGGTGTVSVTASSSSCSWTTSESLSWVSLSPASGTGSGSVTVSVTSNTGAARSGSVTIAGRTYTISQAGVSCTYSISPTSGSFLAGGGTETVSVTTSSSSCSWTTSESLSWVSLSPASGTGSGSVTVSVTSNTGAARSGSVTIAGRTYSISQTGVSCTYSISPTSGSFTAGGGTETVSVTTSSSSCSWTTSESLSWVSLSPASGTGSGSVTVSVTSNTGAARSGSVTIAGRTYSISQTGVSCTYSISPTSGSFTSGGGTETVSVTASSSSCSWTTSESLTWVSLSPASGTGSGSVTVSVTSNTGAARSGSVTIAGRTYTISQAKMPERAAVILRRTSPDHVITSGSVQKVYGTSAANQITLESGAKAELINFPGENSIYIQSDSDLFTVSRTGTVVTFTGSDGTILKIPATRDIQTIFFNEEESRVLKIHGNQVMLDDQVITTTPEPIENNE